LHELGLGGTAVGTGVNRHPDYPRRAVEELARSTGLPLWVTRSPIALHSGTQDFAGFAAALKGVALELGRLANDLRLMGSGPTTGIGEIALPAVQPGSSIMPGKVNPVLAESLNMVCLHVLGAEAAVAAASGAGQFQINVMTPLIAFEVLFSLGILTHGVRIFRRRCVEGLRARPEAARRFAESTVALGAVLNPRVGYHRAAEIVTESIQRRVPVAEVAAEKLGISLEEAQKLLAPERWIGPGVLDSGAEPE
jgi:aspartate ammonia-lyase